jgi:hypothetical protein
MPQPLRWLGNRIKSGTHFSTCTCKMGILDTFLSVAPFSTSYHIISLRRQNGAVLDFSSLQIWLTRKALSESGCQSFASVERRGVATFTIASVQLPRPSWMGLICEIKMRAQSHLVRPSGVLRRGSIMKPSNGRGSSHYASLPSRIGSPGTFGLVRHTPLAVDLLGRIVS